jgi:hydroxymethylpyrimidine/phosphomethylpyrimidine kinase
MRIPVALTIAGSDSGGGAGIQADLKTFHAFGVFGTSAITAVTVQDTMGVRGWHAIPAEIVAGQIDVVAGDLRPRASKTGMLASRALVETVADAVARNFLSGLVVDPVMVATSGDRLLDPDAEEAIVHRLLPLAALVTPNLPEAGLLTGLAVEDEAGMSRAAAALVDRGAGAALLKGGHLRGSRVVDVLFDGATWYRWERPRIGAREMHGTGCTLSAAVAAGLAHGQPLADAVAAALEYVHRAIEQAPALGAGSRPLNHLVQPARPVPPQGSTSAAR